jgi:hypothetical protein
MNKKYTLLSIFILVVFSLLISSEKVLATVGGPSYISQISYKASDNSVYYLENDEGGKGCPPIIHSINLAEIKDVEVKTCDEVIQQYFSSAVSYNEDKYRQFIDDTYKNFSYPLTSVSLKKNNIDVHVEVLSENENKDGEKLWTEFRATLTQDNKEIAKLDFRGCDKDQPNIFEGYRLPDTDAIAILISGKGDCMEGGYIKENLSIIKGIKYYDTNIVRSIKEKSAIEPNEGNIVVYATSKDSVNDNIKINNTPTTTTVLQTNTPFPQTNPITKIVLMISIFIVGTAFGYVIGKKFS